MSKIDYQALRADAMEATGGSWVRESGEGWEAICCDDDQGNAGFIIAEFQGENATANRKFVQSANPATVLALLDELDKWQQESSAWQAVAEKQLALATDAEKRIAELEAREVSLPERSSMLQRADFHDDYQTVMAYKVSEVIAAIRASGIRIKGE